jgi:hypothetical protein
MLKQSLQSINSTLDDLISITLQDIEDIKKANHDSLFQRNEKKEELIKEFTKSKSQIDSILVQRSQSGLELSQLINPQEDQLLGEFKDKLSEFYNIHKKFSKMALLVTNFYNNLLHKTSGSEPDIGYEMKPNRDNHFNFSLKA